jgi:hypothetical protein
MATPTGQELTYDCTRTAGDNGACREFWMRFPGLRAASDADSPGDMLYYLENPFNEDLLVLRALIVITTLDAQDGDIDVGLADDVAGTGIGAEFFDSIVNTATGVFEGLGPTAVAGTAKRYVWSAKGTSTNAYLYIFQNGDVDCSSLRWNLFLKVIPYADLIGGTDLGACPVA